MSNGSPSSASMFSYAEGVSISGGNFTINTPTSIMSVLQPSAVIASPIDQLRAHCALNAVLNSSERFNAPRCEPQTREAIIQEILDWINEKLPFATMLWLHGSAGVGKSAIAQSISELCRRNQTYGASFFFSRTEVTSGRNDGDRVLPTLVYQMAQAIPALLQLIQAVIELDRAIFMYTRALQMERLLVQPLLSLQPQPSESRSKGLRRFFKRHFSTGSKPGFKPCLIVVDGLDECSDIDAQCDLLRLFATAVTRLNLPIRFLISSRPEAHITQTFKRDVTIPVQLLNLGQDRNVNKDIRLFLARRFEDIRHGHPIGPFLPTPWPPPEVLDALVKRSSEHFIFPSIVMEYVASVHHHPIDRLNIILDLRPAPDGHNPYATLDALYRHIFSAVPKHHLEKVLCLLGLINLQNQSNIPKMAFGLFPMFVESPDNEDSPYAYAQKELIERMLELRPGEVEMILASLLSVVECQDTIRVLHASIFDFLCDSLRAKEFHVDLSEAHTTILHYFIREEGRLAFYTSDPVGRHPAPAHPTYIFQHLNFFMFHLSYVRAPVSTTIINYLRSFNLLYNIALSKEVLERSFRSDTKSYHAEVFKLITAMGFFFEWLRAHSANATGQAGLRLDYHTNRITAALSACYRKDVQIPKARLFQDDRAHLEQYTVFQFLELFNTATQYSVTSIQSRTSELPRWVLLSPWGDPSE
ncbi:hypothetical protein CPB83DRAFT_845328 [Crepidotus variabilis]|uniref:NACHT domain-containing protein n=1 Tax=Crepidotus variabilis TaxID=179855 RepID=A0A9P6JV10_9AGAR|nr:hypothetical protein CPB83DRAFT_845328 [Crepidotus variabilis]